MGNGLQFQRLYPVRSHRLRCAFGSIAVLVVLSQLFAFRYENYFSVLSRATVGMTYMTVSNANISSKSQLGNAYFVHSEVNDSNSIFKEEEDYEREEEGKHRGYDFSSEDGGHLEAYLEEREALNEFAFQKGLTHNRSSKVNIFNRMKNLTQEEGQQTGLESIKQVKKLGANATEGITVNASGNSLKEKVRSVAGFASTRPLPRDLEFVAEASHTLGLHVAVNLSLTRDSKNDLGMQPRDKNNGLLQIGLVSPKDSSAIAGKSVFKKSVRKPMPISYLNTLLRHSSPSAYSVRPHRSSARDKELWNARHQIENAPVIRNAPKIHASLFRNYSMFIRSYELMEDVLRLYVYKEGEKPIFHQPYLRGIYASEGWFMKLIEKNKQFVVRDPRKAHLFYLPFSSLKLRDVLHQQHFASQKDLESFLKNYVDIIARRYHFWNRTKGADHFLVACHDWAPRFTRQSMGCCIRALCNSNIARGFEIGKDVSLPVTYIRSAENPIKDLGGNQPSARPILAFFAGGMHGYLRPILLQHWNNKEPDMKIFGPMPRDVEGKARYREFMKSSKYCICAKGYEVHTPRVVESIYYECVPVIISDNYVPPFFEVFDWESFSVFILEKDVPNLRKILLSIPEEKYKTMQSRLKILQQYFLWHKNPVKYDLFHMILHSIWYNRVFQVNYG